MHKIISSIILLNTFLFAHAQFGQYAGTERVVDVDVNPTPLGFVTEVDLASYSPLKGSQYYNEEWYSADLYVGGKKYKNLKVKINTRNYNVEVKTEKFVRILTIDRIDSVLLKAIKDSSTFVNASKYSFDDSNVTLVGFAKILSKGTPYSLIELYKTKLIQKSYVRALDIGKNEKELVPDNQYFLVTNFDKGYTIDTRRKKLTTSLPLSDQQKTHLKQYLKGEKPNLKKEKDLLLLLKFLNTLH